jgi:ketosteroid isomerase-like protein
MTPVSGDTGRAMSEENVELFHRSVDAINRRDLEAFMALMDQDVQAVSRIANVEGGLHGHEGIRKWWDNWLDAFPDYQLEVVDIRDHGDVLIATFSAVGHGATSRLPFEDNGWIVGRWRDGRCTWWQICRSEAEALGAAGLPV